MSGPNSTTSWRSSVWQAVLVLLAAAIAARLVYELLGPLVPSLAVLALLVGVYSMVLRRPR